MAASMQDRARPFRSRAARWSLGATLCAATGLAPACSGSSRHPVALPVTPGTPTTSTDPFDIAIATYRSTGQAGPLVEAIAANPDDERAGLWHELLALAAYERAWTLGELHDSRPDDYDPAPQIDTAKLRSVAAQYPDTFAGGMATVGLDTEKLVLENQAVRYLAEPVLNPHVVAFLAGDASWAAEIDDGPDEGVRIDVWRFRQRYAPTLKLAIAAALEADGCQKTLGYCRWYVQQFPDDPSSDSIGAAVKREWHRRAHPPWQGKAHLQCAYDCTRRCKAEPTDLDDTCYGACFAKC